MYIQKNPINIIQAAEILASPNFRESTWQFSA